MTDRHQQSLVPQLPRTATAVKQQRVCANRVAVMRSSATIAVLLIVVTILAHSSSSNSVEAKSLTDDYKYDTYEQCLLADYPSLCSPHSSAIHMTGAQSAFQSSRPHHTVPSQPWSHITATEHMRLVASCFKSTKQDTELEREVTAFDASFALMDESS